jgi:transposase-like protein
MSLIFLRKSGHGECRLEPTIMTGKRYDKQFKTDAVRHWIKSGKSVEEVAASLGISTWSLRRWKSEALKEMDGPAEALGAERKPSEMEEEIRRLRDAAIKNSPFA